MKPVEQMSNQEITAEALRLAGDIQRTTGAPHEKALAAAQRHLGISVINQQSPEEREAEDARLEKEIELAGDKQMRTLGFEIVKFSHPGKTKQTPGIADRRYYHRARKLAFWWEVKSASGRQRPDQKDFQELVEASGDLYVLGTDQDLFAWLIARGLAVRDASGNLVSPEYEQRRSA